MNDAISRQQAIDALGELATFTEDWSCHTWMYTDDVYNAIKELPPIQPKRGKWFPDNNNYIYEQYVCSECKNSFKVDTCMGKPQWNFCPNCGADMRGEHDG